MSATNQRPTVFIVDDDARVRLWIGRLLDTVGVAHAQYANAEDFLAEFNPAAPGCILLDVRMPGMGGRVLQEKLADLGAITPILFMTGFGEVSMAVDALKAGAVEFLEKPIQGQDLLDRVQKALERDANQRETHQAREQGAEALDRLTPRERQVVDLLIEGQASKQIAFKLSVSSQAIDARKQNAMRKLGVDNLAELVAFVMRHRAGT
jgi:FixJ family two-component response regulator